MNPNSRLILSLAFVFAAAFAVHAQQVKPSPSASPTAAPSPLVAAPPTAKPQSAEKLTAKDYSEMLAKLKKGDYNIDFAKLRLAYTETDDYSPYGGGAERREMYDAVNAKDFKKSLEAANKILETNFVDLAAQFVAGRSNAELNKMKEAAFHKTVFEALLEAITANDGKTAQTAMLSIGISEQYFIMNYFGFERGSKALLRENNSIFDVHDVIDTKTKEKRKLYFNIDKVFGRF